MRKSSSQHLAAYSTDQFELPLPERHRFPIAKYRLLRERIAASGSVGAVQLCSPPAATDQQLGRVHTPEYLEKIRTGALSGLEQRRIGFPWSAELVERSRRSVGATLAATRSALRDGVAVNLAGGTHHAFADRGQGFCVFNDVAVAIRVLQHEGRIDRAVVIDCDVHQGNGTADVFAGDETVFTFSMHGDQNFPFAKVASDLDIALPDGTTDVDYLEQLRFASRNSIPLADADCVFYLAGADAYQHDRLGRLKLTKEGLAQRDRLVLHRCQAAGVPVAVVMAGGYGKQIEDTVDIHARTVQLALEMLVSVG